MQFQWQQWMWSVHDFTHFQFLSLSVRVVLNLFWLPHRPLYIYNDLNWVQMLWFLWKVGKISWYDYLSNNFNLKLSLYTSFSLSLSVSFRFFLSFACQIFYLDSSVKCFRTTFDQKISWKINSSHISMYSHIFYVVYFNIFSHIAKSTTVNSRFSFYDLICCSLHVTKNFKTHFLAPTI